MAKSLRSKSERKKRSIRRSSIYQPAADARIERLSKKAPSMDVDAQDAAVDSQMVVDAVMTSARKQKLGRPNKRHGRRPRAPLNAYGISARELAF